MMMRQRQREGEDGQNEVKYNFRTKALHIKELDSILSMS